MMSNVRHKGKHTRSGQERKEKKNFPYRKLFHTERKLILRNWNLFN